MKIFNVSLVYCTDIVILIFDFLTVRVICVWYFVEGKFVDGIALRLVIMAHYVPEISDAALQWHLMLQRSRGYLRQM